MVVVVLVGGQGERVCWSENVNFSDHVDGQFVHGCGQEGVGVRRLLSASAAQIRQPPSFARVVMLLKEEAVADGSVGLVPPAPHTFVSCLFDVINMCCFHLVWPKIK